MREYKILESIEIHSSLEKVFAFLADVEKRIKLSSVWEVISVKNITGSMGQGAQFHIKLKSDKTLVEQTIEFIEFVKNKKIVTKSLTGDKFQITLTLEGVSRGTILTHEEIFESPEEISEERIKKLSEELKLWLISIKRYLELENSISGKLKKFFIDKVLLEMTPSHRRITLHIITLNIILFIMALALIIVLFIAIKYAS
ncbi:MAG: SRPBCC domain-containing protein [Euryarchaeota archaeon]|nr:SRPBCC domain-containing protein [Euryarchaeota archaeon]